MDKTVGKIKSLPKNEPLRDERRKKGINIKRGLVIALIVFLALSLMLPFGFEAFF
ncbi:MAG: hypothetical protein LBT22_03865 [Peptococcaceae bacterium]|jgi:hypothetical protein|nr:hypothetical protein [Peptococcaceae bacterium]